MGAERSGLSLDDREREGIRMLGALCAESDLTPDYWDLDATTEQHVAAATICQQCPMRDECVQGAMNDRTLSGVWGGRLFGGVGAVRGPAHGRRIHSPTGRVHGNRCRCVSCRPPRHSITQPTRSEVQRAAETVRRELGTDTPDIIQTRREALLEELHG